MCQMKNKLKNGVIAGGLISTAGLFIAKMIGLAYTIPFSYILASDAYMGMYGGAYRIYSYLLQVFTAGFPFAIATITAKYATENQWNKVRATQRISTKIMTILGFIGMLAMVIGAPLIAPHMTTPENIGIMTFVLMILGVALFVIPILSSYRGYLEGLKQFRPYSISQVVEQIVRVGFLLGIAGLVVYVFKADRVWALYASVLSTSVAGFVTVLYLSKYVRQANRAIPKDKTNDKSLFKEIILLAIPYFTVAVLGYLDDIISSTIVPDCLMRFNQYTNGEVEVITSALNYAGTKLVAIPLILAPGFTASLIPHITENLTNNALLKVKDTITKSLQLVVTLAFPVCAFILMYARPIYSLLFYTDNLNLSAYVVQLLLIEGFFGTLSPVMTNIIMACRERKKAIYGNIFSAVFRVCGTYVLMYYLGIGGAVLTSILSHLALIVYYSVILAKNKYIDIKKILITFGTTMIITGLAYFVSSLCPVNYASKLALLITLGVVGIVYVAVWGIETMVARKVGLQ